MTKTHKSKCSSSPSSNKLIRRNDKRAKVSNKYPSSLVKKIFNAPQKEWRKIAEKNNVPIRTGKNWRSHEKVEEICIIKRERDDCDLIKTLKQLQRVKQSKAVKKGLGKTVQLQEVKVHFKRMTRRKLPADKIIYNIMQQFASTQTGGRTRRRKKMLKNKESDEVQRSSIRRCSWNGG